MMDVESLVFVVDDDTSLRTSLQDLLESVGLRVAARARRGRAAWGWVLGSDGTRNQCKPAITVAELLPSAKKGRLWRNGHGFVRKSPLQKGRVP